jgi:hypothetical protein
MAQYKVDCPIEATFERFSRRVGVTEITQGKTSKQKEACANFIAALKKSEAAVNKCDPNCNCKGETVTAAANCINNALKTSENAANAFDNAMNG